MLNVINSFWFQGVVPPVTTPFIAAHNAISGSIMDSIQQTAVTTLYNQLSGIGTPNGNNLLSYFQTNSSSRLWILVPVNDTTVNANAYTLDAIHLNQDATYNGFVSGDFLPTGVAGGSGKFFNAIVSPSNFGQNNLSVHVFGRDFYNGPAQFSYGVTQTMGITSIGVRMNPQAIGRLYYKVNASGDYSFVTPQPNGLVSVNRASSTTVTAYENATLINTISSTSETPPTFPLYFYAVNSGGSPTRYRTSRMSMYAILPSMTTNQLTDFNFAIQNFQANVITGGR